jgi:uncharacterized membrane protein YgcG
MKNIDFSSGGSFLSTLLAITLVTVIGVGIRILIMATVQQRRERTNRQINERLRLLMAAYKTLGGSFTGDLSVDPAHLRELRQLPGAPGVEVVSSSDRSRRMRDAVESALSDIILLGTEEQVRLAGFAAQELVEGRHIPTHDLVVSLRYFIRKALNLEPIPADLRIPRQGPTRPQSSGGKSKSNGSEDSSGRARGGGQRGGGGDAGGGGGLAGLDGEDESANDR